MNKQELLNTMNALVVKYSNAGDCPNVAIFNAYSNALGWIKLLDEPQKPVVPQFVADWFEDNKYDLENYIWSYIHEWEDHDRDSKFFKWFDETSNKAIETLVHMKDGYEVEKVSVWHVKVGENYFRYFIQPSLKPHVVLKESATPFADKKQADAVAVIVGGEVEESEQ